jgi:predicted helicase
VKTSDGKLKSVEIDLLGKDENKIVLVGECKFKNQNFTKSDLDNFLEKLDYVPMTRDASIIFFSLSGFSEYVQENAENYTLVDVDEMFAPL